MTAPTLDRPPAAEPPEPVPLPAEPSPPAPPALSGGRRRVVQAGWAATLAAALLLGFAGYLLALSGLQQQHFQSTAYKTFRDRLATAVAPTGPTADGDPVAVVDIPAIGLRQAVVVEGTTGRDLMRGPGHRRDSVLPGQRGASVLFGRGSSFGAPFARLSELRVGDRIEVTTGQGSSVYVVNAYGDGDHPITDTAPARLVLVTSDSGWIPTGTVLVGARLDGEPQPAAGGRPALLPADRALAVDSGALAGLQLWALALLGAAAATTVAVRRWHPRAGWLSLSPVLAALLWAVYENAAALLPNLY
ncbi:sortase [Kitasatospora sp. NPDC094015]|uniref:sortase n=1 Tax=Kitasatospora sp. NPDC094015 TaxID=3155205 RepID=UPI0033172B3A